MDLQASGRGRREERVPLDALIELRSDDSDEVLEADGLDLGSGGVSMRASFVPPVGARLECQFYCPPEGDRVRAHGEVVWAEAVGPRSGAFGMRFLELDTKSATAIRRVVEPGADADSSSSRVAPGAEPEELPRIATMRIDGLGAPIETDVRLAESDRIVLEQELSFLKLGRGVEVDVPGRGRERGRIASVELRQGPLNVPTLVFGVLLDEVRVEKAEPVPAFVEPVPAFAEPARAFAEVASPSAGDEPDVAPLATDTWPERPMFVEAEEPVRAVKSTVTTKAAARELDAPRVIITDDADRASVSLSAEEHAELQGFAGTPAFVVALGRTLTTLRIFLEARGGPSLVKARASVTAWLGETLPKLQTLLTQVRTFLTLQLARLREVSQARAAEKRRTTAPAPRPARTAQTVQSVLREAKRFPEERAAPRNRRMLASALAVVGVGLGIYALAPRSEADRIPVRHRPPVARPATTPSPESDPFAPAAVAAQPAITGIAPSAALPSAAVAPAVVGNTAVLDPTAPSAANAGARVFGSQQVPNGRVFAIRMSGPVDSVEGDQREDGFTVRVPGRLALDRASPIATSHRAVARAMILNRGDYAELTVDFLPGLRPKYQVVAKDNAIEVTLERL